MSWSLIAMEFIKLNWKTEKIKDNIKLPYKTSKNLKYYYFIKY